MQIHLSAHNDILDVLQGVGGRYFFNGYHGKSGKMELRYRDEFSELIPIDLVGLGTDLRKVQPGKFSLYPNIHKPIINANLIVPVKTGIGVYKGANDALPFQGMEPIAFAKNYGIGDP